jgi:hypothetical protein
VTVKDGEAEFFASIAERSEPWQRWAKTARTAGLVGATYGAEFLARSNASALAAAKTEDEREGWAYGFEWSRKEVRDG